MTDTRIRARTFGFNPDQERDDKGRWSPSGSAAAAALDEWQSSLDSGLVGLLPRLPRSSPTEPAFVALEAARSAVASPPEFNDFDRAALAAKDDPSAPHDAVLEDMWATRGFDGPPTVVPSAEFERLAAEQDMTVVYRGVSGDTKAQAEQHADQFRTGDAFAGRGGYGAGTYATTSYREAYMKGNIYGPDSGTVIRMAIPKDMVTAEPDDLQEQLLERGSQWNAARSAEPPNRRAQVDAQQRSEQVITKDMGRYATAMGIQAVSRVGQLETVYNVQDRSALLVDAAPASNPTRDYG